MHRTHRFLRNSVFVFTTAFCATRADAGVLKVGGPAPTHPTIQAAVDAAIDGDVVLVQGNSTFSSFVVDGKSIAVVADQTTLVELDYGIYVRNIAAGKTATISGFRVPMRYFPGLRAENCAGAIRAQDIVAFESSVSGNGSEGAWISSCANIAFERCTFAATATNPLQVGYSGIYAQDSHVALHDCTSIGGRGGDGGYQVGNPLPGEEGGSGITVVSSTVFMSGSTLVGGVGGHGLDGPSVPPCATQYFHATFGGGGGIGLEVRGATSVVRLLATTLNGGTGGLGGSSCAGYAGSLGSGVPMYTYSGTVVTLADVARSISLPRPVREGASLDFDLTGAPFERAFLAISSASAHSFAPNLNGVLLGATPYRRVFLGTLDANGMLHATLPIGELGLGVTNIRRHAQCVMIDTNGASRAGGSAEIVLLDSSY